MSLAGRRVGGLDHSVRPRDGTREGPDGGKIVELDSSRTSRTHTATATPDGCDRAIVVRPTAVPFVPRPDRLCRPADGERLSRPNMPRAIRSGAHREQETNQ